MATLVVNNKSLTTDEEKANIFRAKLATKFHENEEYYEQKKHVENSIDNIESFYANSDKSIRFITVTEIKMSIKKLNSKTSSDTLGISNRLIHKLPQNFIQFLSILFNKCLKENKLPNGWKFSRIVMLHKKDDAENIKNYRAISSTPCLMRLFEKIIYHRISEH
jgi:hypothetical protein